MDLIAQYVTDGHPARLQFVITFVPRRYTSEESLITALVFPFVLFSPIRFESAATLTRPVHVNIFAPDFTISRLPQYNFPPVYSITL